MKLQGASFLQSQHYHPEERRKVRQSLSSQGTLDYIANKSFPRLLPALLDPLDAAAKSGDVIDVQGIGSNFIFLQFAHIAFAVSQIMRERHQGAHTPRLIIRTWKPFPKRLVEPSLRFIDAS